MRRPFLVLACLLSSCSTAPTDSPPANLTLTEADAGKTVAVAKGGEVNVTLEGNPTTGYSWTLLSGDDAVLKPAGDPVYTPTPVPSGMVGSGGAFEFKFQALSASAATLKFAYLRPWEKAVPPAKTFEVTVRVP